MVGFQPLLDLKPRGHLSNGREIKTENKDCFREQKTLIPSLYVDKIYSVPTNLGCVHAHTSQFETKASECLNLDQL